MTNKDKFIETFSVEPVLDQCPVYCNICQEAYKVFEADKCRIGDWWRQEYHETYQEKKRRTQLQTVMNFIDDYTEDRIKLTNEELMSAFATQQTIAWASIADSLKEIVDKRTDICHSTLECSTINRPREYEDKLEKIREIVATWKADLDIDSYDCMSAIYEVIEDGETN